MKEIQPAHPSNLDLQRRHWDVIRNREIWPNANRGKAMIITEVDQWLGHMAGI